MSDVRRGWSTNAEAAEPKRQQLLPSFTSDLILEVQADRQVEGDAVQVSLGLKVFPHARSGEGWLGP